MNVNGITGLFPLSLVMPGMKDYYINKHGEVLSTKLKSVPQRLTGSGSGNMRAFSLTDRTGYVSTFRQSVLLQKAATHAQWVAEITDAKPSPTSPADRNHAESTRDGIKSKGYIIGKVDGEAIVFGSKPKIHTTLASVKSEVQRLAEKSPGTQIIYVKIEGAATANAIAWE